MPTAAGDSAGGAIDRTGVPWGEGGGGDNWAVNGFLVGGGEAMK